MSFRASRSGWALPASVVCVLVCLTQPGLAGVTSSTDYRDYIVRGTSRSALLSYMKENPFPGDEGPAYANIRQTYSLAVHTREQGGVCRPSAVDVNIHFVITLPKAANASSLAGDARASWYQFVAFARHHEETRRSIFLECGRAFVAKAMQLSSKSCSALEATIRNQFEAAKIACDRRQTAYGRADDPRVRYLSLFRGRH